MSEVGTLGGGERPWARGVMLLLLLCIAGLQSPARIAPRVRGSVRLDCFQFVDSAPSPPLALLPQGCQALYVSTGIRVLGTHSCTHALHCCTEQRLCLIQLAPLM